MDLLRRLFGSPNREADVVAEDPPPASAQELDEEERRYERELADFEQHRLDELRDRQLRYADRAWTPPVQGGERRADDTDAERNG